MEFIAQWLKILEIALVILSTLVDLIKKLMENSS